MPWDSVGAGSVLENFGGPNQPQHHHSTSAHTAANTTGNYPAPGSSGQSPKLRRRVASGSSSTDSLVRQSLEFENQQLIHPAGKSMATAAAATISPPVLRDVQRSIVAIPADLDDPAAEVPTPIAGKSSSGPINSSTSSSAAAAAAAAAAASAAATAPTMFVKLAGGGSVKRTHSLKDDLIKRFQSTFVNNNNTSGGGGGSLATPATAAAAGDSHHGQSRQLQHQHQQQQQQQQQQQHHRNPQHQPLSRSSRPGSLRSTAAPQGGSVGSSSVNSPAATVVKVVLPDKKQLLNKANSSENLTASQLQGAGSAADLSSLTSLVQRKRDRSQDSSSGGGTSSATGEPPGSPPRRQPHVRKAPAPPTPQSSTPQPTPPPAAPPSPPPEKLAGDLELGGDSLAKAKPPTGRREQQQPRTALTDDLFSTLPPHLLALTESSGISFGGGGGGGGETPGRDSPSVGVEEVQSAADLTELKGGGAPSLSAAAGAGPPVGHYRSSSFELLQDAVQSRTAPKIRQPSAIRKTSDSHQREASPSKVYGSSPPKVVSFNPTDEVVTYEGSGDYGGSRSRKSHQHRASSSQQQPQLQQRSGQTYSKLSDNALIDVHTAMVEKMENIVVNQRSFLDKVKEGAITVANYRESTKHLLALQTRTIQQILDAIQSNEKPA